MRRWGRGYPTAPGVLPNGRYPPHRFCKETSGPPQFPSYPFENMPWSKIPVVTRTLAIAPASLLPSVTLQCVGFPPYERDLSLRTTTIHFFGTQYRACNLAASSFRPPLPALPVDFAYELLAKLCSCGTCTHWVTKSNFILHCGGIPTIRI